MSGAWCMTGRASRTYSLLRWHSATRSRTTSGQFLVSIWRRRGKISWRCPISFVSIFCSFTLACMSPTTTMNASSHPFGVLNVHAIATYRKPMAARGMKLKNTYRNVRGTPAHRKSGLHFRRNAYDINTAPPKNPNPRDCICISLHFFAHFKKSGRFFSLLCTWM